MVETPNQPTQLWAGAAKVDITREEPNPNLTEKWQSQNQAAGMRPSRPKRWD